MALIKVIEPENASGELLEIYDSLKASRGKIAEIHKIQSLNPKSITAHMDLYMELMYGKSPLRRYQREMIGTVVSKANRCPYCVRHHGLALEFYWKDPEKVRQLAADFTQMDLKKVDLLLCKYAGRLTSDPDFPGKEALLGQMRAEGLDDRAILDATLIIAYFNFVNRIVLGLEVEIEADGGGGYKY